ncbi:sugar kinase [Leptolyngbya sp. FACHB-711]|uniref:sugar kinase n=1 Tax=unclassified Leptolyngbya TaxID=2650499 RepID=UPI001685B3CC|nr:sugar kinase [Leptolyngbya sp. FACHB-711]MBD1850640.1 sugar kinase [Cyanobacteria bacterium FACHB-502]MBD2025374.1 sugar kinase [Leptolyngbya sp. FACHB-711]
MARGLFVGLVTLDLIYLVEDVPDRNQKQVALDYVAAAGGPATNAAMTFSDLGNEAQVLGVLGLHPIRELILADVQPWGVTIVDLQPHRTDPPPTSSILVTQSTGERAVISLNAVQSQADPVAIPPEVLSGVDVVLIDGHQMRVSETIARQAKAQNIPIVVDGGSWKPGFERVLPEADFVICSANFRPPGKETIPDVLDYLEWLGVPHSAVTQGEQPIAYRSLGQSGEVAVPRVQTVDTLGAGDVFHGAFCHFCLQSEFTEALTQAAQVASRACTAFGTRSWMRPKPL